MFALFIIKATITTAMALTTIFFGAELVSRLTASNYQLEDI